MSSAKRQRHNEHRRQGHQQATGEAEGQSQRLREGRAAKSQQALEPGHYGRIAAIATGGIILIAFLFNVINHSVGDGLFMLGFFAIYGLFVAVGVKWWRQQRYLRGD